jgi:uncharacterized protein (TIRG00374 family)
MAGFKSKLFLFFRLFGITIFLLLLFKIDLKMVWQILKQINLFYFILALLLQILFLLLKGLRWHIMKKGNYQFTQLIFDIGTFLESYAIGVVTPGRVGELMKAAHENSRNNKWSSVFRVIAERGFDLGFFFLIAGISLTVYPFITNGQWLAYLAISIGILAVLCSCLLLSSLRLNLMINRFLSRISRKRKNLLSEGFNLKIQKTFFVLILSILGNLLTFLSCYFLALGVNLGSSFLFTSGGVAIAGIINLLPITIMGLGTRELTFLFVFQHYEQSVILAFTFAVFLTLQIGGGLISLLFGQVLLIIDKKYMRS